MAFLIWACVWLVKLVIAGLVLAGVSAGVLLFFGGLIMEEDQAAPCTPHSEDDGDSVTAPHEKGNAS